MSGSGEYLQRRQLYETRVYEILKEERVEIGSSGEISLEDSLAVVEFVMELEERFNIRIEREDEFKIIPRESNVPTVSVQQVVDYLLTRSDINLRA